MVKIKEADNLIDHERITGLSNVGVEVFIKDDFWGTALTNDIYPEEGRLMIEVYLQKSEPGSPYEYKAIEDNLVCASDIYDFVGEEEIDDDSEIVIRFVDLDNNGAMKDYEPCAVWANIERDEITFTVKTLVFGSKDLH